MAGAAVSAMTVAGMSAAAVVTVRAATAGMTVVAAAAGTRAAGTAVNATSLLLMPHPAQRLSVAARRRPASFNVEAGARAGVGYPTPAHVVQNTHPAFVKKMNRAVNFYLLPR